MTEAADVAASKQALRQQLVALRRALSPDQVEQRGARVQARLLATAYFERAQTVAVYAATPGEVPTGDVVRAALASGKTVCYPVPNGDSRVLAFRAVGSEAELVPGRWSIREPPAGREIPLQEIELFAVPGLGFTRDGKRLGRGGGYYDATLEAAALGRRVGLAFGEQIVDALPVTARDVAMDLVVTETETLRGLDRG